MTKEERLKIYEEATKKWGVVAQYDQCIEEMAELSKELLKNINRGKDNYDEIVEETADVIVCLEHIKLAYELSDNKLNEVLNEKMPRKWLPRIEKWKAKK